MASNNFKGGVKSLRAAALTGVKWSALGKFLEQLARSVSTPVLAVFLEPADFGLVGLVAVILGFLSLFREAGAGAAIVREKNISDALLRSMFYFNVALGTICSTLVFFGAGSIASYFQSPNLVEILRASSLTFFLASLSVVPVSLARRRMQFRSLSLMSMAASIAGLCTGLSLAVLGCGVWSLVFQSLVSTVIVSVVSIRIAPIQLSGGFCWREFRSILGFSGFLTGFNFLNYFCRNSDNLLIGKYLGASPLGHYAFAYNLMLFPIRQIVAVISSVLLPVFARLQDDDLAFRKNYLVLVSMIAFIVFPCVFGFIVVIPDAVAIFLGQKWAAAAAVFKILGFVALAQAVSAPVGTIYTAKGRTDLMLAWAVIANAITLPAFWFGLEFGINGVATAYTIVSICLFAPCNIIPFRLIGLRFGEFLGVLSRYFLCACVMAIACLVFRNWWGLSKLGLLLEISLGVAVYSVMSFYWNRPGVDSMLVLLRPRVT